MSDGSSAAMRASGNCRNGAMTWLSMDAPIGKSLEAYGEWAQQEIEFVAQFVKHGDVVVDVGAHVGSHTLAFSKLAGSDGHIHAIEPHPVLFELLCKNIEINNLGNVHPYQKALSDLHSEALTLSDNKEKVGNRDFTINENSSDDNGVSAFTERLESTASDNVNFIRLNLNGNEIRAIKGLQKTIKTSAPIIYSKCSSLNNSWELIRRLTGFNYTPFFISFPLYNGNNHLGNSSNCFGLAQESSLLFIPQSYLATFKKRSNMIEVGDLDDFAIMFFNIQRYGDKELGDGGLLNVGRKLNVLNDTVKSLRRLNLQEQMQKDHYKNSANRMAFHLAKLLSEPEWKKTVAQREKNGLTVGFEQDISDIKKSGLLDEKWYRGAEDDPRIDIMGAIEHYLFIGAERGSSPSANFDGNEYWRLTPGSYEIGVNPLIHSIRSGTYAQKDEKRENRSDLVSPPVAPSASDWQKLKDRADKDFTGAIVDIIMPVYQGFNDTLASIYSVLNSENKTKYELTVINDSSPDPELVSALKKLSADGIFTLLENQDNIGFVKTVNIGMRLHSGRDVLLLNSDTIVYGNWVDRMRNHVLGNFNIGTITPLSNNAAMCSYPVTDTNNIHNLEIEYERLDELISKANSGHLEDIPTGVGFCFYINRHLLNKIGYFDEELFKKGYGEENDFSLRANNNGWRNVVATDIFVRHTGAVSFKERYVDLKEKARLTLLKKYPDYPMKLWEFGNRDKLLHARRNIDIDRLNRLNEGKKILHVFHLLDDGIKRHVYDMASALRCHGVGSVFLQPEGSSGEYVKLRSLDIPSLPNLGKYDIVLGTDELISSIKRLNIFHIHVHSLVGYFETILQALPAIAYETKIEYDFTFHDYMPICPRIHMCNESNSFCDTNSEFMCQQCLIKNSSMFGCVNIKNWRESWGWFINGARRLFAPSEDTSKRIRPYFPRKEIGIKSPIEYSIGSPVAARAPKINDKLTVVLIGQTAPPGEASQMYELAKDALDRNLSIEFIIIGDIKSDKIGQLPNVIIKGKYHSQAHACDLIEHAKPQMVLLTSVWPATYCYPLSLAILAGVFPVIFDIGEPAERLRDIKWGEILPYDMINNPEQINNKLLEIEPSTIPENIIQALTENKYNNLLNDYYGFQAK